MNLIFLIEDSDDRDREFGSRDGQDMHVGHRTGRAEQVGNTFNLSCSESIIHGADSAELNEGEPEREELNKHNSLEFLAFLPLHSHLPHLSDSVAVISTGNFISQYGRHGSRLQVCNNTYHPSYISPKVIITGGPLWAQTCGILVYTFRQVGFQ